MEIRLSGQVLVNGELEMMFSQVSNFPDGDHIENTSDVPPATAAPTTSSIIAPHFTAYVSA